MKFGAALQKPLSGSPPWRGVLRTGWVCRKIANHPSVSARLLPLSGEELLM